MGVPHFLCQTLRRRILKCSPRDLFACRGTSAWGGRSGVWREDFSAAIRRSVGEELTERGEKCLWWLIFLCPLPPLSQLLILRPQVGREEGEGILHMRVPTATGHQTRTAIPGSPLVSGNHLCLLPRSQL